MGVLTSVIGYKDDQPDIQLKSFGNVASRIRSYETFHTKRGHKPGREHGVRNEDPNYPKINFAPTCAIINPCEE